MKFMYFTVPKHLSLKAKTWLIITVIILLTLACQTLNPSSSPTETPIPPSHTLEPTDTPEPTNTPEPTMIPKPTNTPAPTSTPEPEAVLELFSDVPDWAAGQIGISVLEGEYVYPNGATARAGSLVYVEESDLSLNPGTLIQVGAGGVTLDGIYYSEGAKLLVHSNGEIELLEGEAGGTPPGDDNSILPGWQLLMSDTFDSNVNNWYTGDENYTTQEGFFEVTGGVYSWFIESTDQFAGYFQIAEMDEVSDFYTSVEVTRVGGVNNAAYGIVFRIDQDWNKYRFLICADCSSFIIVAQTDDWYILMDWTDSSAINLTGTNELAVLAEGTHLQFFINGEMVAELDNDQIPSGIIGLSAEVYENGNTAEVEFDNFSVYVP